MKRHITLELEEDVLQLVEDFRCTMYPDQILEQVLSGLAGR